MATGSGKGREEPVTRVAVKVAPGRIVVLDPGDIYYFEGERGDALVRTARKTRHRSVHPLSVWQRRLRGAGFVRIHRSYLVNLDRVREIRLRRGDPNDWEIKLAPPVNAVLPIGRTHYLALRKALGL